MSLKRCGAGFLAAVSMLVFAAIPALAHGDIIVPQVADGSGSDGTRYKTKFDISNLSQVEKITKVKVIFSRQDGTAWSLGTNQGTGSEFTLSLGPLQTIRIETNGTASLTAGYAVIRNPEITTVFSEDFEVSVTAFYEVSRSSGVVDTVSVPTSQPTVWFAVPVETDTAANILSGLAIVNLDPSSANRVELRLWQATSPSSGNPTDLGTVTFTMSAREQRARFLNETGLYPNRTTYKGLLVGITEKPVAILALLQTPAGGSVQYATLAATRKDALRTSTYMYLRQGFALDADIPQSDYFGNTDENLFWDVLYETQSNTQRRLLPQSGAQVSSIGIRTDTQFDNLTLEELQAMSYSTTAVSLNDGSANLAAGYTFAIRTGLGRYAKVHVGEIVTRVSDTTKRDLVLEMYVYRPAP
jgi:hypothetical protein